MPKPQYRIKILSAFAVVSLALGLAGLHSLPARSAVTTELLVSDRHSGLALFGFDPVSYYIDSAARAGSSRFEVSFGGLTWRFRSEANRAAFMAQPGSYMPNFGGYDPIAVVRGVPLAGHPAVFAIYREELFLFATEESRAEFMQRPDPLLQAAKTAWPAVRKTLLP